MAGQGPNRRQLLQAIACASIAGAAPGFSRWAYGFAEPNSQHPDQDATSQRALGEYKPRFFSPAEYKTIGILAELIIPHTPSNNLLADPHGSLALHHKATVRPEDAGAIDAGVDEFIDFMVAEDATLQTPFREGLAWLDQANGYTQPFSSLAPADQNDLLERLAYSSKFRSEDKQGQAFFALLRKYTVMGFYTSHIGIESLDFPGFRHYTKQPSAPSDGSLPPMAA